MDPVDAEIFLSGQINRKQKKGIKVFVKAVHGTGHDKFSRFFHRVHEPFDFLCPGVHDGVRDCRILSPDIIVNVQKSGSKPSGDKLSQCGFSGTGGAQQNDSFWHGYSLPVCKSVVEEFEVIFPFSFPADCFCESCII